MIHIDSEGSIMEVGGSLAEIGANATQTLMVAIAVFKEKVKDEKELAKEVRDYIETMLLTLLGSFTEEGDEAVVRGIKEGYSEAVMLMDDIEEIRGSVELLTGSEITS